MKIVQTSKCMTALELKAGVDVKLLKGFKIPYSTTMRYTIPTVWDKEIFVSNDPTLCPITSCT